MIVQATTSHPSQAPTVEEIEKEDINTRQNVPPEKTLHVLESSEDDTNTIQPRKKIRNSTKKRYLETSDDDNDQDQASGPPIHQQKKNRPNKKKKPHHSPILEDAEGDDAEDGLPAKFMTKKKMPTGQAKKSSNVRKNSDHDDSDIEVIEKESPEKEWGMWIHLNH